jgi:hypothetical protein
VNDWLNKGGKATETEGRKCLCNGLMANIGLAQERALGSERALLTAGNDLAQMRGFVGERSSYSVADVIHYLLPPGAARSSREFEKKRLLRSAPLHSREPRMRITTS